MTAVIPGNRHRTAIPRTAFRAFVTVVAALFQELGVCCHAIIAMRCISSVCGCYSRNMDINCHCHALAFGVCDYTIPGNGHPTAMPHAAFRLRGYSNSKKWASSTTVPRTEFRENSFVTKDCCIPGNRHQLPIPRTAFRPNQTDYE